MDTYKNLILQYSTKKESFSLDDLWGWLSAMGLTTRSTMNCMLSRMVDKGELVRIARGVYASAGHKNLFTIELTAEEQDLARNLKERFPFAPLCIYNGKSIAPLQHHLSGNNMTYVETDRQAMESIFEYIKEHTGKEVWLIPDADMVYRYIDLEKGGIIVKPLVTEAPLQTMEGVSVPTLEKLLVDINKDADFSYLHGAEAERMMDNAKALYVINTTRLRRYAKKARIENRREIMIDSKCFTTGWIEAKAKELNYSDTNLIEKVIRALSLLDMLARSGCPFHFKGGSCLMLLLHDTPHRLSIDIDIMCPPGTDIEQYLASYADCGFIDYKLVERKQAGTDVPKSHSKFFYQVAFKADMDRTSYILLDVLYEDCHYQQVERVPIQNELIETVGECPLVNVPSIGDILGDKLTAFAPETTGIPYYKNDKLATLEIIKQLYDVGRLFDRVDNLTITEAAFSKIAPVELGYRGLPMHDLSVIYEDIRQTALNISTRGFVDKEKFALLQKGITSIRPFMYRQNYKIEDAIADASKAAYLATLLEKGIHEVRHYDGNPLSVSDMTIGNGLTTKLNKLRMGNSEAFFYWSLTDALL